MEFELGGRAADAVGFGGSVRFAERLLDCTACDARSDPLEDCCRCFGASTVTGGSDVCAFAAATDKMTVPTP